jgi:hypothetical protein
MKIAPVNQSDLHRRALQRLRRRKTAKTATQNYDPMRILRHGTLAMR